MATMILMALDVQLSVQPQLRDQRRDGSIVRDGITSLQVFSSHAHADWIMDAELTTPVSSGYLCALRCRSADLS